MNAIGVKCRKYAAGLKKASAIDGTDVSGIEKAASSTKVPLDNETLMSTGGPKKVKEKPAKPARVLKKSSTHQKEPTTADATQRENAMQWASTMASETEIVAPNATKQGSTLPRKKCADKGQSEAGDTAESLAIQDFIASQYPPLDVVSSPVRLGRALVSEALGRKVDDPKMF